MTHPTSRHAAPDQLSIPRATRTVRFWITPISITLALLSALAALYLGGILNPGNNIRHFPIAVVNEDTGPTGQQVIDQLAAGMDREKFDLRELSAAEAAAQLDTGKIYGQLLIPADFTAKLQAFGSAALQPGTAVRPNVTLSTNPRAGTLAASIAGQALTRAAAEVNTELGQRISADVTAQAGPPPAGVALALATPVDVQTEVHHPLPDGTGNGLSAFYYALLLLLAGFTGSLVVSTLVDSMLGYTPAEIGPVYHFAEQAQISRFRTLLVKWAMMAVLAVLASGVFLAIAHGLGMPIQNAWQLWAFGAFAITAVGVTATSVIAALGTIGLLVNLLVFVILGLPSAGATVPLEAAPRVFGWLSTFEPMHQVFLGVRALLYFDGRADAGLGHALQMTGAGLFIGLLLGGIVTHLYDRKGYHRLPGAVEAVRTAPTSGGVRA